MKYIPQTEEYWINRPIDDPEHDWKIDAPNWIEGYVQSKTHPHRQLILNALQELPCACDSLLEVGCNTGPNLSLIHDAYPTMRIAGVDVNEEAIKRARIELPDCQASDLVVAKVQKLPFADQSFDVVLCDAVLMYVPPKEITAVIKELNRVAKYAIIVIDRFAMKEEVVGHVFGRDYSSLLSMRGFTVEITKITEQNWPHSENWAKYGYVFTAVRS